MAAISTSSDGDIDSSRFTDLLIEEDSGTWYVYATVSGISSQVTVSSHGSEAAAESALQTVVTTLAGAPTTDYALPWDQPWGVIERLTRTTNQAGITTGTNIFSFTMPTWPAGRLVKVTFTGNVSASGSAGTASAIIRVGGVDIVTQGLQGTATVYSNGFVAVMVRASEAVSGTTIAGRIRQDSGAGSATYDASSTRTGYFVVEDLGPAPV